MSKTHKCDCGSVELIVQRFFKKMTSTVYEEGEGGKLKKAHSFDHEKIDYTMPLVVVCRSCMRPLKHRDAIEAQEDIDIESLRAGDWGGMTD